MDKKGMEEKVVIGLIILIVGGVVIGFFVSQTFGAISKKGSEINCKTSIEAASRSKNLLTLQGKGRPISKLDCPRGNLTIKKSQIVEENKINQDKAHKIIADSMWSCWKKVGQGRLDPFSNWDTKEVSYCLICDTINFDEELKGFVGAGLSETSSKEEAKKYLEEKTIGSLTPYLLNNGPDDSDKTYYELLFKQKGFSEYLKQIENFEKEKIKSIILPGTVTLIQMHKLDSKSTNWKMAGVIGGVVLLGVGTILTGGLIWVGAGAVFAGTIALSTAALITVAGIAGISVGGYMLVSNTLDAYADCPTCQAAGGPAVVPSDNAFDKKIQIEPGQGKEPYEAKLCDVIVN